MFIEDKYFDIFDDLRVISCMEDLKGCVREQDIDGFGEVMPRYNCLILELALTIRG